MTLIVRRKNHNPIFGSRFFPDIKKLVKKRGLKAIGVVYISLTSDERWECHKCGKKHSKDGLTFDEGHDDILMDCPTPTCKYPFLVIKS